MTASGKKVSKTHVKHGAQIYQEVETKAQILGLSMRVKDFLNNMDIQLDTDKPRTYSITVEVDQ